GVGRQTAVGATREIVVIPDLRIGGEVAVRIERLKTILRSNAVGVIRVRVGVVDELLQTEVEAGAALSLALTAAARILPDALRIDTRVVERGIDAVPGVTATAH